MQFETAGGRSTVTSPRSAFRYKLKPHAPVLKPGASSKSRQKTKKPCQWGRASIQGTQFILAAAGKTSPRARSESGLRGLHPDRAELTCSRSRRYPRYQSFVMSGWRPRHASFVRSRSANRSPHFAAAHLAWR